MCEGLSGHSRRRPTPTRVQEDSVPLIPSRGLRGHAAGRRWLQGRPWRRGRGVSTGHGHARVALRYHLALGRQEGRARSSVCLRRQSFHGKKPRHKTTCVPRYLNLKKEQGKGLGAHTPPGRNRRRCKRGARASPWWSLDSPIRRKLAPTFLTVRN